MQTIYSRPNNNIFNNFFSSTTLTSVLTSSNPQQQQPLTVTPASGGFPNLNGTSLYRQSFGQSNGNATFPPTAALLQNQSPTLQNGIFLIFLVSMEPFFSYPLLDYFEFRACLAGRYLCSQNIFK